MISSVPGEGKIQVVAIMPEARPVIADAVTASGARLGPVSEADVLVWLNSDTDALAEALKTGPRIRWIQLPSAGVESFVASGVVNGAHTWACAKGAYAETVADHALMLVWPPRADCQR